MFVRESERERKSANSIRNAFQSTIEEGEEIEEDKQAIKNELMIESNANVERRESTISQPYQVNQYL